MPQLPPILLCQYRYDPLDHVTGHTVADTAERQRFYCKSRLATEIQGALRVSIIQNDDQLLAQQQREGDLIGTVLLATGQERSVLNTLKNDHQPQPVTYSPYGHSWFESGLLSLLGFNGERRDPVTGHYLLGNGYRAFNPVLMRFNSPDSWSPFGKGGLNAYAYCLGDPVNQTDPTGHGVFPKNITGLIPNQPRYRGTKPLNTVPKHIPTESIPLPLTWENGFDASRTIKKTSYLQELKKEANKAAHNKKLHDQHVEFAKIRSFSFIKNAPKLPEGGQTRLNVLNRVMNQHNPDQTYKNLKLVAEYGEISLQDRNYLLNTHQPLFWERQFTLNKAEAKIMLGEFETAINSVRTGK